MWMWKNNVERVKGREGKGKRVRMWKRKNKIKTIGPGLDGEASILNINHKVFQ